MRVLLLLLIPAGPFLLGLLLAGLVHVTPFVRCKLAVARMLLLPYRWIDPEEALFIGMELEWRVRARYGKKDQRALYGLLLRRSK